LVGAVDNSKICHKKAYLQAFFACGKIITADTRCSGKRGFSESSLLFSEMREIKTCFDFRASENIKVVNTNLLFLKNINYGYDLPFLQPQRHESD
jgi:hypothetical protein